MPTPQNCETHSICQLLPMNCLRLFDHFVMLVLRLNLSSSLIILWLYMSFTYMLQLNLIFNGRTTLIITSDIGISQVIVHTIFIRSNNTETFRKIVPHKTIFVRVHIKQYWHFPTVTTKQYNTHFLEFILCNTFSQSSYQTILTPSQFLSS